MLFLAERALFRADRADKTCYAYLCLVTSYRFVQCSRDFESFRVVKWMLVRNCSSQAAGLLLRSRTHWQTRHAFLLCREIDHVFCAEFHRLGLRLSLLTNHCSTMLTIQFRSCSRATDFKPWPTGCRVSDCIQVGWGIVSNGKSKPTDRTSPVFVAALAGHASDKGWAAKRFATSSDSGELTHPSNILWFSSLVLHWLRRPRLPFLELLHLGSNWIPLRLQRLHSYRLKTSQNDSKLIWW